MRRFAALALAALLACSPDAAPDAAVSTDTATDTQASADAGSSYPGLLHHLGVPLNTLRPPTQAVPSLGLFGGPDPEGAGVRPNIALRVEPATAVTSPIAGRVENRLWQGAYGDWELHLRLHDPALSRWLIILDHVVDAAVDKGADVKVGTALGKATPWGPGYAQVEVHIVREPEFSGPQPVGDALHVCPTALLAEAAAAYKAEIVKRLDARARPPLKIGAGAVDPNMPACLCAAIPEAVGSGGKKLACP